jgi:hypothetical protein
LVPWPRSSQLCSDGTTRKASPISAGAEIDAIRPNQVLRVRNNASTSPTATAAAAVRVRLSATSTIPRPIIALAGMKVILR